MTEITPAAARPAANRVAALTVEDTSAGGTDAEDAETVPGLEGGILLVELAVQLAIHGGFPCHRGSQRDGIAAGFVLPDLLDPTGHRQDLVEI